MVKKRNRKSATWESDKEIKLIDRTECQHLRIGRSGLKDKLRKYDGVIKSKYMLFSIIGCILPIVLVFLTSDFNRSFLGFSSEIWESVILLLLISLVMGFVYFGVKFIIDRKVSLDSVVDELFDD
jgi:hypothetical protein